MPTIINAYLHEIPMVIDAIFESMNATIAAPGYSEVLPELVDQSATLHQSYFEKSSDPNGQKWAKLAKSTIGRKGHDRILIDTGKLKASLSSSGGTSESIRELHDDGDRAFMTFGTSMPYAKYHMTGTRRMPARPEVGANDKAADQMTETIAGFVADQLVRDLKK